MPSNLIAKNISKSFGNRPILRGVNCQVSQGEAVGIFGPNGAGKTTLFSIVVGLVKTDLGQLMMNDQDISRLPMYMRARLGIGYLPQESSVFRGLSVQDNIRAILEINSANPEQVQINCEELMDEFSITHLRNKIASTLSGGERRRLEIARALASKPKFILLDEPLAGIDPIAISEIKHLISHLKERDIGVLITDHNVRDSLDIVDRAYVIYEGKVLIEGSSEDIINSDQARKVYLGTSF